ncbi:hypothetical protein LY76DRAFT_677880 [Colletotrichum caudatum]|nr:hypothetical protein LY76DRAFT_677880 [Colletotrichum caudatum]
MLPESQLPPFTSASVSLSLHLRSKKSRFDFDLNERVSESDIQIINPFHVSIDHIGVSQLSTVVFRPLLQMLSRDYNTMPYLTGILTNDDPSVKEVTNAMMLGESGAGADENLIHAANILPIGLGKTTPISRVLWPHWCNAMSNGRRSAQVRVVQEIQEIQTKTRDGLPTTSKAGIMLLPRLQNTVYGLFGTGQRGHGHRGAFTNHTTWCQRETDMDRNAARIDAPYCHNV